MRFTLNGKPQDVTAPPLRRLLDVLREECALPGTKEGCGEGECGACTVLLDGQPVASCLVPFAQAQGTRVTTIEGLGGQHPLQRCFVEQGGAQCGICTPGMIMTALALPPGAGLAEIREGLAGNLCRCTGYTAIYRAVEQALEISKKSGKKASKKVSKKASKTRAKKKTVGPKRATKPRQPPRRRT
jgi:aerobic carbon-monoxide dehydrogenase small subunit